MQGDVTHLLFAVLLVPGLPSVTLLSAASLLILPPSPNPEKNPLLTDGEDVVPLGVTKVVAVGL